MPGPSYNNPQLEYVRNKKNNETAAQRLKTEREKAKVVADNAKTAASLRDQISQNNKTINSLSAIIKSAEVTKAEYVTQYNAATRNSLSPSSPGGATQTSGELAAIASYQTLITGREQLINNSKNNIKDLKNKNNGLLKQYSQLFNANATSNFNNVKRDREPAKVDKPLSGPNNQDSEGRLKPSAGWKYNLPLILPARFSNSSTSPLVSSLEDNSKFAGVPDTTRVKKDYWQDDAPGRGVLRVNKKFLKDMLESTSYRDVLAKGGRVDPQLYGFRFQYNPERIAIQYSNNENINPAVLAEGPIMIDPFVNNVVISMELILNRMEDMKYRENPSLAIRKGVYGATGATESLLPEVRELHEKGTMYDLEYLFKTYHTPLGSFESLYNGKTADRGFIQPTIIELHLGNKLRYPGRILGLTVEHRIFDPRMVPIFSVIRLSLGRIHDYGKGKTSGGGGAGRNGGRNVL